MRISDGSSDVCSSDLSQILSEDPDAHSRTLEQEPDPEWNEFTHLAFWHDACPEVVLSIPRPPAHSQITADEHAFLAQQIGRASVRDRVGQYVSLAHVHLTCKKTQNKSHTHISR